jgi:hypothetical protein
VIFLKYKDEIDNYRERRNISEKYCDKSIGKEDNVK